MKVELFTCPRCGYAKTYDFLCAPCQKLAREAEERAQQ